MPLKPARRRLEHLLLWPAISTRAFPFSATSVCSVRRIDSSPRFLYPIFGLVSQLLHPFFILLSFSSQRRCIPFACGSCYGRPFGGRDGTQACRRKETATILSNPAAGPRYSISSTGFPLKRPATPKSAKQSNPKPCWIDPISIGREPHHRQSNSTPCLMQPLHSHT
jgi:hypothetical protein